MISFLHLMTHDKTIDLGVLEHIIRVIIVHSYSGLSIRHGLDPYHHDPYSLLFTHDMYDIP